MRRGVLFRGFSGLLLVLRGRLPRSQILAYRLRMQPKDNGLVRRLLPQGCSLRQGLSNFIRQGGLRPTGDLFAHDGHFSAFGEYLMPLDDRFLALDDRLPAHDDDGDDVSQRLTHYVTTIIRGEGGALILFSSLLLNFVQFSTFTNKHFDTFFDLSQAATFFTIFNVCPPFFLRYFRRPIRVEDTGRLTFLVRLGGVRLTRCPPCRVRVRVVTFNRNLRQRQST